MTVSTMSAEGNPFSTYLARLNMFLIPYAFTAAFAQEYFDDESAALRMSQVREEKMCVSSI
jgi:hypothetical protein